MLLLALVEHELNPAACLPFLLLLVCVAVLPQVRPQFWECHHARVALGCASVVVAYYVFGLHAGGRLLTVSREYVSFIAVIGSLYVVAGGIHVRTRGEATPGHNLLFLLGGALLANLVGTTGASMLLIRPWIRLNRYRYTHLHTAFFVFLISNIGGGLTPIGDPPLLLGFLKGVPFWWVAAHGWPAWLMVVGILGLLFYLVDRRNFLAAPHTVRERQTSHESFQIAGLANVGWLALVLTAVFLTRPPLLREALMLAAAVGSYFTTSHATHRANHFSFGPIKEVAWLFAGIFATMVPALDFLQTHATALGITTPRQFYWMSGALSGVLDNAPTYLALLTTALGLQALRLDHAGDLALLLDQHSGYVVAVSLGSVFFGAMTYIGNGPNLMVKAIADQQGVHTPHFFRYLFRFSVPLLLPVLALVAWLFLR